MDNKTLHDLNKDGEKLLLEIQGMSVIVDLISECEKTYKLAKARSGLEKSKTFMDGLAYSRLFHSMRRCMMSWINE